MLNRIILPLVFVSLALYILLGELTPMLYETAEITPFYTTDLFAAELLGKPCGFVFYLASFLQSTFATPWIGAVLLCLLLSAIAIASKFAFRVSLECEPLCWVAPVLLLLNFTQLGYMLYELKAPAVAFTAPLGFLFIALIVWGWNACKHPVAKWLMVALLPAVGYMLMGVYALFAIVLILVADVCEALRKKSLKLSMPAFVAVVLGIFSPFIIWRLGMLEMRADNLFFAGLPDFLPGDEESGFWNPLKFSALALVLMIFIGYIRSKKWRGIISCILLPLAALNLFMATNRDSDLLSLLNMKRAIECGEYDDVLSISRNLDSEPTRLHVWFTRLALKQQGAMCDSLFFYPDGNAGYKNVRMSNIDCLIGAAPLYYHFGLLNFSYRWCMENMVTYGQRPGVLKYMTKIALLNGENELAAKYLHLLGKTLVHRDFVEKYSPYVNDKTLISSDEEMKKIRPLVNSDNILDIDGGAIERFLLYSLSFINGNSLEVKEMQMMNALLKKDVKTFLGIFAGVQNRYKGNVPLHIQEGLVQTVASIGVLERAKLPVDKSMKERFLRFQSVIKKHGATSTARSILYSEFGHTYWFYYYFGLLPKKAELESYGNIQER